MIDRSQETFIMVKPSLSSAHIRLRVWMESRPERALYRKIYARKLASIRGEFDLVF